MWQIPIYYVQTCLVMSWGICCLGLPCAGTAGVPCTTTLGSLYVFIRNLIQTCTGPPLKGSAPTSHDQIKSSELNAEYTHYSVAVTYEQWDRYVTKVYFVITEVCKLLPHLRRK